MASIVSQQAHTLSKAIALTVSVEEIVITTDGRFAPSVTCMYCLHSAAT